MPGINVRLREVITPELFAQHREHIHDFLLQEGIDHDPDDLLSTEVSERQVKELLEELAESRE